MASRRDCDVRSSKADPCDVLCNTFNKLCFKKSSKHCFYEDYVLLKNQLLLLEYDEDDPSVPSKLFDVTELLRRYIEDVPKPVQQTIEFVEDVRRKLCFLHDSNCRHTQVNKRFPLSEELHLLLICYVELEYEVLYCPQNYSPEYQKRVENRILSLLMIMLYDPTAHRKNGELVKNMADACAMNALYVMRSIKSEYKKEHSLVENIMIKLLRKLNALDKVNEIRSRNKNLNLEKLLQVPQVQKIYEYLQRRDCASEDSNQSDDEVEDLVEEVVEPVKSEIKDEIEEKIDPSSFACYNAERKVMTIDLDDEDEDCYMIYFRDEVQKLDDKKDKKFVFDHFNVQNSPRTTSNISDSFDSFSGLNSFTTSSTCDNKTFNPRCVSSDTSVYVIDDDSDSDIEVFYKNSSPIVDVDEDNSFSPVITNDTKSKQQQVESHKGPRIITHSSDIEEALLQCDDISDDEIENEDEILNKYSNDGGNIDDTSNISTSEGNSNHLEEASTKVVQTNSTVCDKSAITTRKQQEVLSKTSASPIETPKSFTVNENHLSDKTLTDYCFENNHFSVSEIPLPDVATTSRHQTKESVVTTDTKKSKKHSPNKVTKRYSVCDNQLQIEHFTANAPFDYKKGKTVEPCGEKQIVEKCSDHHNVPLGKPTKHDVEHQTTNGQSNYNEDEPVEKQIVEKCSDHRNVTLVEHQTSYNEDKTVEPCAKQTVERSSDNHSVTLGQNLIINSDDCGNLKSSDETHLVKESAESSTDTQAVVMENECTNGGEDLLHSVNNTDVNQASNESAQTFVNSDVIEESTVAKPQIVSDENNKSELINLDVKENLSAAETCKESEFIDVIQDQVIPLNHGITVPCISELEALDRPLPEDKESELSVVSEPDKILPETISHDGNILKKKNKSKVSKNRKENKSKALTIKTVNSQEMCEDEPLVLPNGIDESTPVENHANVEVATPSKSNHKTSEDSEELQDGYTNTFTEHSCSNNLDVLAYVAAEQQKMEDAVQGKGKGNKKGKRGRKPGKKVAKNLEPLKIQNSGETGMVTRRITRSSSLKNLETDLQTQEQCKCIPSTFMNLENLITPPPIRVYNLIPNNITDNEESLDEPFTCIQSCDNQHATNEIVTTAFDEDTIEDGITLISHKKETNNGEVVISIPESEREYPGINYDILIQAEEFEKINLSLSTGDELCKELHLKNPATDNQQVAVQAKLTPENVDDTTCSAAQSKEETEASQPVDSTDVLEDANKNTVPVSASAVVTPEPHEAASSAQQQNQPNIVELRDEKTSHNLPNESETKTYSSIPLKKNKRRTWFYKATAQLVPVKKRKNYGKRNEPKSNEVPKQDAEHEAEKPSDSQPEKEVNAEILPEEIKTANEEPVPEMEKLTEQVSVEVEPITKLPDDGAESPTTNVVEENSPELTVINDNTDEVISEVPENETVSPEIQSEVEVNTELNTQTVIEEVVETEKSISSECVTNDPEVGEVIEDGGLSTDTNQTADCDEESDIINYTENKEESVVAEVGQEINLLGNQQNLEIPQEIQISCDDNIVSEIAEVTELNSSSEEIPADHISCNEIQVNEVEVYNNQDSEMPLLEREEEEEAIDSSSIFQQREELVEDNYPLLVAYEIETVAEEVVESYNEPEETSVQVEEQTDTIAYEQIPEVSPPEEETPIIAESNENVIGKATVSKRITDYGKFRKVRTKAALKAFQNPYVNLQKLPAEFDYKKRANELYRGSLEDKTNKHRSKSSDGNYKQQKHDRRASSETKHKKKPEELTKLQTENSSKKEKVKREIDMKFRRRSTADCTSDKESRQKSKNKEDKEGPFKAKTRSRSQKQKEVPVMPKVLRSSSESKLNLKRDKSKPTETFSEEKPGKAKNKYPIVEELPLFSVEDSSVKITYITRRRKSVQEALKSAAQVKEEKNKKPHEDTDPKVSCKDKSFGSRSSSIYDKSEEENVQNLKKHQESNQDAKNDKQINNTDLTSEKRPSTRSRSSSTTMNESYTQKDIKEKSKKSENTDKTKSKDDKDKPDEDDKKSSDHKHRNSRRSSQSSNSNSSQDLKLKNEEPTQEDKKSSNKADSSNEISNLNDDDVSLQQTGTSKLEKSLSTDKVSENRWKRERRGSVKTGFSRESTQENEEIKKLHKQQSLESKEKVDKTTKQSLTEETKSKSADKVKTRSDSRYEKRKQVVADKLPCEHRSEQSEEPSSDCENIKMKANEMKNKQSNKEKSKKVSERRSKSVCEETLTKDEKSKSVDHTDHSKTKANKSDVNSEEKKIIRDNRAHSSDTKPTSKIEASLKTSSKHTDKNEKSRSRSTRTKSTDEKKNKSDNKVSVIKKSSNEKTKTQSNVKKIFDDEEFDSEFEIPLKELSLSFKKGMRSSESNVKNNSQPLIKPTDENSTEVKSVCTTELVKDSEVIADFQPKETAEPEKESSKSFKKNMRSIESNAKTNVKKIPIKPTDENSTEVKSVFTKEVVKNSEVIAEFQPKEAAETGKERSLSSKKNTQSNESNTKTNVKKNSQQHEEANPMDVKSSKELVKDSEVITEFQPTEAAEPQKEPSMSFKKSMRSSESNTKANIKKHPQQHEEVNLKPTEVKSVCSKELVKDSEVIAEFQLKEAAETEKERSLSFKKSTRSIKADVKKNSKQHEEATHENSREVKPVCTSESTKEVLAESQLKEATEIEKERSLNSKKSMRSSETNVKNNSQPLIKSTDENSTEVNSVCTTELVKDSEVIAEFQPKEAAETEKERSLSSKKSTQSNESNVKKNPIKPTNENSTAVKSVCSKELEKDSEVIVEFQPKETAETEKGRSLSFKKSTRSTKTDVKKNSKQHEEATHENSTEVKPVCTSESTKELIAESQLKEAAETERERSLNSKKSMQNKSNEKKNPQQHKEAKIKAIDENSIKVCTSESSTTELVKDSEVIVELQSKEATETEKGRSKSNDNPMEVKFVCTSESTKELVKDSKVIAESQLKDAAETEMEPPTSLKKSTQNESNEKTDIKKGSQRHEEATDENSTEVKPLCTSQSIKVKDSEVIPESQLKEAAETEKEPSMTSKKSIRNESNEEAIDENPTEVESVCISESTEVIGESQLKEATETEKEPPTSFKKSMRSKSNEKKHSQQHEEAIDENPTEVESVCISESTKVIGESQLKEATETEKEPPTSFKKSMRSESYEKKHSQQHEEAIDENPTEVESVCISESTEVIGESQLKEATETEKEPPTSFKKSMRSESYEKKHSQQHEEAIDENPTEVESVCISESTKVIGESQLKEAIETEKEPPTSFKKSMRSESYEKKHSQQHEEAIDENPTEVESVCISESTEVIGESQLKKATEIEKELSMSSKKSMRNESNENPAEVESVCTLESTEELVKDSEVITEFQLKESAETEKGLQIEEENKNRFEEEGLTTDVGRNAKRKHPDEKDTVTETEKPEEKRSKQISTEEIQVTLDFSEEVVTTINDSENETETETPEEKRSKRISTEEIQVTRDFSEEVVMTINDRENEQQIVEIQQQSEESSLDNEAVVVVEEVIHQELSEKPADNTESVFIPDQNVLLGEVLQNEEKLDEQLIETETTFTTDVSEESACDSTETLICAQEEERSNDEKKETLLDKEQSSEAPVDNETVAKSKTSEMEGEIKSLPETSDELTAEIEGEKSQPNEVITTEQPLEMVSTTNLTVEVINSEQDSITTTKAHLQETVINEEDENATSTSGILEVVQENPTLDTVESNKKEDKETTNAEKSIQSVDEHEKSEINDSTLQENQKESEECLIQSEDAEIQSMPVQSSPINLQIQHTDEIMQDNQDVKVTETVVTPAIEIQPKQSDNLKVKSVCEKSVDTQPLIKIPEYFPGQTTDKSKEHFANVQREQLIQKRRLSDDTHYAATKKKLRTFSINELLADDSRTRTANEFVRIKFDTNVIQVNTAKTTADVVESTPQNKNKKLPEKRRVKCIDSIIKNLKSRNSQKGSVGEACNLKLGKVEETIDDSINSSFQKCVDSATKFQNSSVIVASDPANKVNKVDKFTATPAVISKEDPQPSKVSVIVEQENKEQNVKVQQKNILKAKAEDVISEHEILKMVETSALEPEIIDSSLIEENPVSVDEIIQFTNSYKNKSRKVPMNPFFTEKENYELMLHENAHKSKEIRSRFDDIFIGKDVHSNNPLRTGFHETNNLKSNNIHEIIPISQTVITETVESSHLLNDGICENIFPYSQDAQKSIDNVDFSETVEISTLPNDILNFKDTSNPTVSSRNKSHSLRTDPIPQSVAEINQIPLESSVQLLNVSEKQPSDVIVDLTTSNAEASTSCETTDNLIAVIFSNVTDQTRTNKTGFIYFRGTDHNYHSVGDPLLGGECDANESDRSSDTSKEIPTPELESVLVDDNILPYIPTLGENNQEPSSSLNESSVDSSTDFQLLEQCLIGNTLGRESSPPLPQTITCDNLYQTNLKQEVLEYDENSGSNNIEFSKDNSEVYINQYQQQTMSVENMSELMNVVLTSIQNLNKMATPTQDPLSKDNSFQAGRSDYSIESDNIQTTPANLDNSNIQNLESNCNFVQMSENSNIYIQPESTNISFINDLSESDFTNFYYLPVAYDNSVNGNMSNKKVIVERIPQYPEQPPKPIMEITNSIANSSTSLAGNRITTNLNVQPLHTSKQLQVVSTNTKKVVTSTNKMKQSSNSSNNSVRTSSSLNLGFVRTSSRTRVSAPKPKKPSDRKSLDDRDSESNTTDGSSSGNETEIPVSHGVKLKIRSDLSGKTTSAEASVQTFKIIPSKERSLYIIEDSHGTDAKKQIRRLSVEESNLLMENRLNTKPKQKVVCNLENTNKLNNQSSVTLESVNKLGGRTPKHVNPDNTAVKETHSSEQPKELDELNTGNENKLSEGSPATAGQSDMIDNVKRRKRKPVDYSSIEKLLQNDEYETLRIAQKTKNKKEENDHIFGKSKGKRKQDSSDDLKAKSKMLKPSTETDKNKPASTNDNASDVELDAGSKSKHSIFEDSDDDIPKKKKSKQDCRLEPETMNALFDKLVEEGNVNNVKPVGNKSLVETVETRSSSSNQQSVKTNVQQVNKDLIDSHTSCARTLPPSSIFNIDSNLQKKSDVITPVKQIGVVNPIPRPSNNVRKELPCGSRSSYSAAEEGRSSSQYYPYYPDRSRRSYPYSSRESSRELSRELSRESSRELSRELARESSRSSHQGSSRRVEYPSHSSDQRYSQRSSSSSRSSRSSRHHSISRSSTEQRSYRYTSASDLAWREDMKKKFPHMFKDEVFF